MTTDIEKLRFDMDVRQRRLSRGNRKFLASPAVAFAAAPPSGQPRR